MWVRCLRSGRDVQIKERREVMLRLGNQEKKEGRKRCRVLCSSRREENTLRPRTSRLYVRAPPAGPDGGREAQTHPPALSRGGAAGSAPIAKPPPCVQCGERRVGRVRTGGLMWSGRCGLVWAPPPVRAPARASMITDGGRCSRRMRCLRIRILGCLPHRVERRLLLSLKLWREVVTVATGEM